MKKITQHNFLGGQLDWEMMGRQDTEKYATGATTLKNLLLHKRGAFFKRPGTNLVRDVTALLAGKTRRRLVPYASTLEDGWCILFADGAAWAMNKTSIVAVTTTGTPFFTGVQVDEFDYCQCGDILYMAHQTHEPCRIEHTITNGTHSFTMKAMNFARQGEGVPSISGATVSKTGITTKGPTVTEHYKVSAVFDGVETFPSEDYSDTNCADYDSGYDAWRARYDKSDKVISDYQCVNKKYSGTSYTQPWTQSQKITLKIEIASRTGDDGTSVQWPEQIRIYRRTGSFYGIVGILDTSDMADRADGTVTAGISATYTGTNPSGNNLVDNSASFTAYGNGVDGFLCTGTISITLPQASKKARVQLAPGSIVATEATEEYEDDGQVKTRLASITYTFRPCLASKFTVRLGSGTAKSVSINTSTATQTLTVSRESGDSNDGNDLRQRAAVAVANWANAFADTVSAGLEVTASSATTTLTISANTASFVLSNIRLSATASATLSQTWDDKYYTPDVSITPSKETSVMQKSGDYPACVCLSQQRLIWASTRNDPSRVFMSGTGALAAHAPHQVMVASDPIDFQISATRFPKVNHIVELKKLLMFNGDSEWLISSASSNSGITFETIQAMQHSAIGAARNLKPIVCNNVLLFAERTGQAVRQYSYQLEDDGFGGSDISVFSQSIFRERGIVAWAFQQHPNSVCWCCLSDGSMASLTFNREQDTIAWATHELGGNGKARSIVCSHALTGNANSANKESQIFILVERNATWTLEEMRCEAKTEADTVTNALCLDSMRTLADGDAARPGETIIDPATGEATVAAQGAVGGFAYECRFKSVHPIIRDEVGMAQMDVRCVQAVHLRLAHAVGGKVWAEGVPEGMASELANDPLSISSGEASFPAVDENVSLTGANTRDGRINISQDGAWPFGLLMLETDIEPEENERSR